MRRFLPIAVFLGSPFVVASCDESSVRPSHGSERDADVGEMDAGNDAGTPSDGIVSGLQPGPNLIALDTPKRTYLDLVTVAPDGRWSYDPNTAPQLAKWEGETRPTAVRFQPFTPGTTLSPEQIYRLLPQLTLSSKTLRIVDPPYSAPVAPADATDAIRSALLAAKSMASPGSPVDVLVPPGTFNYSGVLDVGPDVRLRRFPETTGGILNATNPDQMAVHLEGDRSAALFLTIVGNATERGFAPHHGALWIGGATPSAPFVHDTVAVGNDVSRTKSAHIFAMRSDGGLWAFNFAHDGYADSFHHTGQSRNCQVVGNRTRVRLDRGDDFYAFVGYGDDGDPVHHCTCIGNWGRDGHARGLAAVGARFIQFKGNDVGNVNWAGVYLARETSYDSYGTSDIEVVDNTVTGANQAGSHDGLLAFADEPSASHPSASFGPVSNRIERLTIERNRITSTAKGIGNGYGIEIRSSVDTGSVANNTLEKNAPPHLVIEGTNIQSSGNVIVP